MRNLVMTALAATMLFALPASDALAGNAGKHCPPGLAKKHNGCNPPGQVKHRYRVGDRINDNFIRIRRPGRYGLDPYESYYRVGDYVYRVDRETREILDLVGAIAAVLD
ncbi:excinuclease ABC subunit A [Roseovarius sp. CAU 1744]|uniref:excinuclease ABC subunit A n=1 Tax=Roseovarius sp. CAU 1744 TaxID=3140368 RepID=UPI00325B2F31